MVGAAVASVNLFAGSVASLLYVGAMIFAGGILELVDAFAVLARQRESLRLLAGVIYGFAGMIIVFDPLLASAGLSLALGILLCLVGVLRIALGVQHHDQRGRYRGVATGAFTLSAGAVVLVAWPGIALWLLGAVLAVDLTLQAWSFTATGLAIGRVASIAQRSRAPSTSYRSFSRAAVRSPKIVKTGRPIET
jgi:uncharacterized membrane protein HdeD (DUF308 family)